MSEQNLPNGIPPQLTNNFPQEKLNPQFNGVHSAHSSRSSSPSSRIGQIPSSQLPPVRSSVPQSQLPPSRSPQVSSVTQKVGQLSISNPVTPHLSPQLNSSTPNQQPINHVFSGHNISPVPKLDNNNLQEVPLESSENTSRNQSMISKPSSNQPNPLLSTQVNPVATTTHMFQNSNTNYHQPGHMQNYPTRNVNISQPNIVSTSSSANSLSKQGMASVSNLQSQAQFSQQKYNTPSNIPMTSNPVNGFSQQSNPPNFYTNNQSNASAQNPSANMQHSAASSNQQAPSTQPPYTKFNQLPTPPVQSNTSTSIQYQQRTTLHHNRYPTTPMPNPPPQSSNPSFYPPQQPQQQKVYQPPNQIPQPSYQNQTQYQGYQNQSQQQPYQNQVQQPQTYKNQPPQQAYQNQQQQPYQGVTSMGFSKYWGTENYDLLQYPNIMSPTKIEPPKIQLGNEAMNEANCSPEIFRCTMTKIPENNSLLQKSRLPLGVLIHPFKDLSHLPVIQSSVIVRCRACRTYINPFIYFVDSKRWKCNLCYRINELPEEFQYDPISKTYGDPSRRPELLQVRSSTIEYIAPAEYMLRPPQPAIYLFLMDVSRLAVESGYLSVVCQVMQEELSNLPGDARTQIGFVCYDSALHFFALPENSSQPHEMTVLEIDDPFLPTPDNLLVNLKDRMELLSDLLTQLPTRFSNTFDNNSALGAALQVAYKMMSATGGRVTVFQAALPNVGPGALTPREDPSQRSSAEVEHLNPANDFYKRLALECSGQQIAVDVFVVNSQYVDIATISGISRFSGGCVHHFPLFKSTKQSQRDSLEKCLRRYLTRKIGFEAVMRVRCTRGLAIHTFHGNFFVRSTDLLSLPNINPDAGFGMQVSIEENLADVQSVCFQAALLYTSSKGERRIRVHTLCLPIASTVHDIIHSADQQCIVGLLAKMAVDRSMQASLSDAREAFINVAIDVLSSYKLTLNLGSSTSGLLAPQCLKVLPLYISALLRHTAFRTGTSIRLDDRVKAMLDMKTKPLYQLIQMVYPDLYPIHDLENQEVILNSEEVEIPMPPRLQLSARCLDSKGAFLMDCCEHMYILVCPNVPKTFLHSVLGVQDYSCIGDQMYELPVLDNVHNQRLHQFISYLNYEKPYSASLHIIRDNSPSRVVFLEKLVEDRADNALSYHEFLQHLKSQIK